MGSRHAASLPQLEYPSVLVVEMMVVLVTVMGVEILEFAKLTAELVACAWCWG